MICGCIEIKSSYLDDILDVLLFHDYSVEISNAADNKYKLIIKKEIGTDENTLEKTN